MRATISVLTHMNSRFRSLHLALASSVAVSLVVVAYLFSGPFSFRPSVVDAATAEALLKSYATKDSDADGLPDWQEALYGTDPANPESVKAGVRDADAVAQGLVSPRFSNETVVVTDNSVIPGVTAGPTTLTDQFSKELFGQYLAARGKTARSSTEINDFVSKRLDNLLATRYPLTYSLKDIKKGSASGPVALRTYAASAELAITSQKLKETQTELDYFELVVKKDDNSAAKSVGAIGAMYSATAKSLLAVAVPPEAQSAHLALVNGYARMGAAVTDMASIQTDPVRGLVGISKYTELATQLTQSLVSLNSVFRTLGVTIESGAGSTLYALSVYAASPQ